MTLPLEIYEARIRADRISSVYRAPWWLGTVFQEGQTFHAFDTFERHAGSFSTDADARQALQRQSRA